MQRTAEILLTPADLVHAQRLQFATFARSRQGLMRIAILWVVSVVIFTLLIQGWNDPLAVFLFALLVPVVIVLGPWAIVRFAGPINARRAFAQQTSLRRPYAVTWTDTHFAATSEHGTLDMAWADFYRVRQDEHLFMLFESERLYRLLPKRLLTPDQQADLTAVTAPLLAK